MVTVVVVDDSLQIQRSLGRLLTSVVGVEVLGYAEDVPGAIALINHKRPDVVVLDVDLRDATQGLEVLRHVVREHPDIQVITLTNFTWQAMREVFIKNGAQAYFDKSIEFTKARDWIAALQTRRAGGEVSTSGTLR